MDVYKVIINDETGCEKVSLVTYPAVEVDFLAFDSDKEKNKMKLSFSNDEEREVWGVAMLADTPIYRRNGDYEYYVVFDRDNIKKMVLKYFKEQRESQINLQHKDDVNDVTIFESVITSNRVQIKDFEYVPEGSWIIGMKVENDEVWNAIKKGEYRGFSIEGLFDFELIPEQTKKEKDEELDFLNKLV